MKAVLAEKVSPGFAGTLALLAIAILGGVQSVRSAEEINFTLASLDELAYHCSRYATTPEKKANKKAAIKELRSRGSSALDFMMKRLIINNTSMNYVAQDLVWNIKSEEAVPVLVSHLDSPDAGTRKFACYYLGFHDVPRHACLIVPLLDSDTTRGAAIRTLGKWRHSPAMNLIVGFLSHEDERVRILAVNALRDIGEVSVAAHLINTLNDPHFTVRKVAARALLEMGKKIEVQLIRALTKVRDKALREIIMMLGVMKSEPAISELRNLLVSDNPSVRRDAAASLKLIGDKAREGL